MSPRTKLLFPFTMEERAYKSIRYRQNFDRFHQTFELQKMEV